MNTPSAQSVPRPLDADDPVREAVLQAATAPLGAAFGDRVRVEVVQLNRIGPWVFLQGRMRGADGGRPSYAGTGYEARQADGAMSDVYAALLRKADNAGADHDARSWRLSDHAIGPTDVTWLTWPDEHEAPPALFGF
ncbi:hypothetical protein [Amycolatopsis aidingensis]|uniref:hypothetical protein n=1 Tax=Amycolatopsis aidingensis TaxID=2842453 RepID=UPI001C0BDBD7|nr:hypothetical protein [Amycolatopsis aidingensis]